MDGEETAEKIVRAYDEEQMIDLLRRTQELEHRQHTLYGILLVVMGIATFALSHLLGGSDVKDFFAGVLAGLSIGEILAGIYVVGRSLAK